MAPFQAPCRLQSRIPRHQEPVVLGQEEEAEAQVRHRLGVQGTVPGDQEVSQARRRRPRAQTALKMLQVLKEDLPAADEAAKEAAKEAKAAMAAGPAAQPRSRKALRSLMCVTRATARGGQRHTGRQLFG